MSFKLSLKEIRNSFFILSIIYFLVSAIEILGDISGAKEVVYITKPLLMPLLILLYIPTWNQYRDNLSKLLIGALFFAFVGDVALMFVSSSEHYFLLGLGAFMITQILYVVVFSKAGGSFRMLSQPKWLFVLLLFGGIYFLLMNSLYDQLNEMKIPVLVYGAVVCLMGFTSTMRNSNQLSYYLVFIGACFFVASDSLIAINKFLYSADLFLAQPSIMILYVIAQYFIVIGLIKAYKQ